MRLHWHVDGRGAHDVPSLLGARGTKFIAWHLGAISVIPAPITIHNSDVHLGEATAVSLRGGQYRRLVAAAAGRTQGTSFPNPLIPRVMLVFEY